jgi:hypothetical protein
MCGRANNRITPEDIDRAYNVLGFRHDEGRCLTPTSLNLSAMMNTMRLTQLHAKAHEEYQHRLCHGKLRGLTEYRVGVELVGQKPILDLTDVKRRWPNHAGREVDRTRTIIGTVHTHPWDVSQSIGDVRNLIRTNDLLGGVVTHTGRMFLLVKDPDKLGKDRSPFMNELELQRASLRGAPNILRQIGLIGALSASFDLPVQTSRDPYIRALCDRLGLIYYAGDVGRLTLQKG